MASLLKAQKASAALSAKKRDEKKGKGKRAHDDDADEANDIQLDDSIQPKKKRNKQRVLMLSSRGVTHRMRHLMNDLEALLPHVKKGAPPCPFRSSVSPNLLSVAWLRL